MKISFLQVMPDPLKSLKHSEKSIWGATFELNSGDSVVLNASSGKGKTTFTHALAGIRTDYAGEILIDGKALKHFSPDELATMRKEHISFVYQDLQLFPELTVANNLRLKNNLTNTFSDDELKNMLTELGIGDKWDAPCRLLSMGQQQRVAIIRALCQPFQWLIMDEPFSHLDEENAQKCLAMIEKRCADLNAGFILTTLGDYHGFQYDKEINL
jgi:ABC-type lipoprotein export system ATPase subunit